MNSRLQTIKKLIREPQHIDDAEQFCCQLRVVGRQHLRRGYWNEAVVIYGTAFETADKLISTQCCCKRNVDRYLSVAIEFVYVLRKSSYPANLEALLPLVHNRLNKFMPLAATESLISPLKDIAFAPEDEVDYWMELRFAINDGDGQTRH